MPQPWSLTIPEEVMDRVAGHLFPGDGDEHGAAIVAGMSTPRGVRLLARDVMCARDGVDYVPGKRGYRMLTASFVTDTILRTYPRLLVGEGIRDAKLSSCQVHPACCAGSLQI